MVLLLAMLAACACTKKMMPGCVSVSVSKCGVALDFAWVVSERSKMVNAVPAKKKEKWRAFAKKKSFISTCIPCPEPLNPRTARTLPHTANT